MTAMEIRQRIVAPFLDLSDIIESCRERITGHPWETKTSLGEYQRPPAYEKQRIARITRMALVEDRDRRRAALRKPIDAERRWREVADEIVRRFLAYEFRADLAKKFQLPLPDVNAIVREGTTEKERRKHRDWHQARRSRESERKMRRLRRALATAGGFAT